MMLSRRVLVATILGLALLGLGSFSNGGTTNEEGRIAYAAKMESKYGLETGLLRGVCHVESQWTPGLISPKGAVGLCQILPDTALEIRPELAYSQAYLVTGSRGASVLALQVALARGGLYLGAQDGIFGPITYKAVLYFQKTHKLVSDGVVGRLTWAAIFGQPMPAGNVIAALHDEHLNMEIAAEYLVLLSKRLNTNDTTLLLIAYLGGPRYEAVQYVVAVRQAQAHYTYISPPAITCDTNGCQ